MSNWRKPASWRKPSGSIHNGQCAEVACGDGVVGVRDSKDRVVALEFPAAAWTAFTARLRG